MQENIYKCGDEEDFSDVAIIFGYTMKYRMLLIIRVYSGTRCPIQNSVDDFFSICLKICAVLPAPKSVMRSDILPGTAESPGSFSVVLQCCI